MSCQSRSSCDGCSGNSDPKKDQSISIEDCHNELFTLRKRTQELEKTLVSLKEESLNESLTSAAPPKLRSARWFDDESNPGMSSLYTERYFNYGITREELISGKPMIGIVQSGSDLTPCNRYHIELAKRVREGIRSAGGVAFEFPMHPIQESSRRPTACLDRNLAYLGLVETLYGYPLDGVVLLTGCDKTTPACLMAAATVVSCIIIPRK
jgi:dihydroxy-acid dehydratase